MSITNFPLAAFRKSMFQIQSDNEFNNHAIELFRYQAKHVKIYKDFLALLKVDSSTVSYYPQIPFLPVTLFKNYVVSDQCNENEFHFISSGTTGQITSKHYVNDLTIYEESLLNGFKLIYGDPKEYCFLALLPSYLEREGSSLIYMVNNLMEESNHPENGFYLHNHEALKTKIVSLENKNQKIFFIGVTYALLDFFEKFPMKLTNSIVMETGGMKGRRQEIIKPHLHTILKNKSGLSEIHSEYGMTELLSQCYATENGIFSSPPWMKILIRDLYDPFENIESGKTGNINVIDLANIHSCAFIATQDLGRKLNHNAFEVLGRMDNSELRGCNLMID